MNDSNNTYRDSLLSAEQKISESYDKTLITLSGGALGLTITFIKEIVGPSEIVCANYALIAWVSWAVSLSCLLFALLLGVYAFRHARENLDANKLNVQNPGGFYSSATRFLNIVGGILFIAGVVYFVYFSYLNLAVTNVR